MPLFGASSRVKRNMSETLIVSVFVLSRLSKITARRLASGMLTGVSSSVIVSVTAAGGTTPVTVPETVTDFGTARTTLSLAVIVTTPVLVVAFAAMVSVVAVDKVKSPDAAGDTAAETVIVVAVVAVRSSVAVTVVMPPFSEIDAGDKTNVAVGSAGNSANPWPHVLLGTGLPMSCAFLFKYLAISVGVS